MLESEVNLIVEPNLIVVCLIAFVGVMGLLGLLALMIRCLGFLFPVRKSDEELVADAIQQAIESTFPGAKVVKIDEMK